MSYYQIWFAALETMLKERDLVSDDDVEESFSRVDGIPGSAALGSTARGPFHAKDQTTEHAPMVVRRHAEVFDRAVFPDHPLGQFSLLDGGEQTWHTLQVSVHEQIFLFLREMFPIGGDQADGIGALPLILSSLFRQIRHHPRLLKSVMGTAYEKPYLKQFNLPSKA